MEVVYALRNDSTLANMIINNIGEAGQKKRKIYQRRLPENPSKDYYYILRESGNAEPVLVEYGFIDNTKDAKKLNDNIEKYVEGVVKAIADYTGYKYEKPNLNLPNINYYVVKKGDTLYSIAERFNLTVQELKKLNNLNTNNIYIGQKLYVSKETTYPLEIYIVKKGDTLYSISQKFNTTVETLIKYNNLDYDILMPGQEIIVPTNEKEEIIVPDNNLNKITYIVQKGDSLWLIAQRFNTNVESLIKLNNLDNSTLQIGDKLLIPTSINDKYVVKKGDTLWSISKKLNIPVNAIKKINNLTSNLLTIGQELNIK